MLKNLIVSLWKDESGAVIATEYLMLGSIVAVGGASGMAAMRDSVVDEYKELGNSVREIRQTYTPPGKGIKNANTEETGNNPMVVTNFGGAPVAQNYSNVVATP